MRPEEKARHIDKMLKEAGWSIQHFEDMNLGPVRFSIVATNNHYTGLGPSTVNIFRQLVGLEEVRWRDEYVMADDLAGKEDDDYNYNATQIKTKQTNL